MEISTRRVEKAITVDVAGKIDIQNSHEFRKALIDTLKLAPVVIVNLQQVPYIDSSGVASLLEAFRESQKLKKRLILYGLSRMARQVLELTKLTKVFEIYETEDQAQRAACAG